MLGLVHEGGELWRLGLELVGDQAPLCGGTVGIVLGKRGCDEGGEAETTRRPCLPAWASRLRQRAERYAAVGLAPQGTLAVVRGVAGEGGDGEGVDGALRRGGEHGVPLASPVSGGGAKRFGGAQGDRGSGRDLRPGEPEGRARAGAQGTAAGRQGEEARSLARAGAGSHGGGPERNDGQRGAAQGRCGGAHGCPRPGGREGRPDWSPTVARATPLAPPRSGRATKHSTARWGNEFEAICLCRR